MPPPSFVFIPPFIVAAPSPARTGTAVEVTGTAAAAQFAVEVTGTAAVIVTGTTAGVRVLAVKIAAASPTRIAPAVMPTAAPFSVAAALVVRRGSVMRCLPTLIPLTLMPGKFCYISLFFFVIVGCHSYS